MDKAVSSETKLINGDQNMRHDTIFCLIKLNIDLVSIEAKRFSSGKAQAHDISKLATTMSANLSKFYESVAFARENEEAIHLTRDLSTYGICFSELDVIFLEAKVIHGTEVVAVYKTSRGKFPECVAGINGFVDLFSKTIASMVRLHDAQNKMIHR